MSRTVLVLGTDHGFQRRSAEFTAAQHQAFAAFVLAAAKQAGIAGLAEENSVAALAEAGITQSTIQLIAHELRLRHRYWELKGVGVVSESQMSLTRLAVGFLQ